MNNFSKNLALWVIIGLLLIALFNLFQSPTSRGPQTSLAFSDFLSEVQGGRVSDVVIQGEQISGRFSDGRSFSLRPTGVPCEDSSVHARTNVLLYDTGARGVELVRGKLPPPPSGTTWSELRAVLRNPDSRGDDPYAFVSDELRVPL